MNKLEPGGIFPDISLYCTSGHAPPVDILFPVLLSHLVRHQKRLVLYLSCETSKKQTINFVSDYPTLHIGHVIWNELSGLEELVQGVAPDVLPNICVLNALNGSEIYGAIDRLFPEFAGKVVRPDIVWADAAAWVYDNRYFFVRYITKHVPVGIGKRILAEVDRDVRLSADRTLLQRFRDEGRSFVLLGLRVGNRTVPDPVTFLISVIEHLVLQLDRIVVILDGCNSRLGLDPSTSYGSFGPPGGEEPLVEELRIVFALRKHFRDPRIEIVSTVGVPIACSLFWIMQSCFFVAPWGAALAKYRWICNIPGFVITNRFNIAHPGRDLGIYHSPEFMAAPTPMHFIALDDVADAPGPAGFYANFVPDPAAIRRGIDRLVLEMSEVSALQTVIPAPFDESHEYQRLKAG